MIQDSLVRGVLCLKIILRSLRKLDWSRNQITKAGTGMLPESETYEFYQSLLNQNYFFFRKIEEFLYLITLLTIHDGPTKFKMVSISIFGSWTFSNMDTYTLILKKLSGNIFCWRLVFWFPIWCVHMSPLWIALVTNMRWWQGLNQHSNCMRDCHATH